MKKKSICTDRAPQAIGPYSQAMQAERLLFISGQIAIDPTTQKVCLFDGSVAEQTRLALNNLKAIVESQDLNLNHIVKTTVYLTDMAEFGNMNRIYSEFFNDSKPARATVAVTALPGGVSVEIEAIAVLG